MSKDSDDRSKDQCIGRDNGYRLAVVMPDLN